MGGGPKIKGRWFFMIFLGFRADFGQVLLLYFF